MPMVEPLSPWAESKEVDDAAVERLSELFAAVPPPEPLSDVARQRVALRLRSRARRNGGLMLVRLVAVGVVIGVGGAALAQWATVRFLEPESAVVKRYHRSATPPQPRPSRAAQRPAAVVAPIETASPAPQLAASANFPPLPAPAPSSRLAREAASLTDALSALKAGGKVNASRALLALDRHLREFAGGPLELEARVAHVDALLGLGRRQDARRELAALPLESVGRKSELRLIRAELSADDDCRAALRDFQVLLEQPLQAAWAERALFGRGACWLKLGDKLAAERDFVRYLERFPDGRFAEQIRAQRGL